ncbi:hypothetical protein ABZ234_03320 [Nocardiopsis sp. NPDC006198]|uniref:hypothetical protein n=1 Tax=Nocardiopsis sp. NPDC006198 TaxID=3154472 RepID=UPI0033BEAB95
MTLACDLREIPTMAALTAWAAAHGVRITYQGPDHEGHPVYAARRGPVIRVVVAPVRDPHPQSMSWRSPLETLPEDPPSLTAAEAVGRALVAPPGTLDGPAGALQAVLTAAIRATH